MTNEYPLKKPTEPEALSPAAVLHRIDDLYVQLLSTLEAGSAESSQHGFTGEWSAKDVVAHLGRWEAVALEAVNGRRKGASPAEDYDDYQRWNELWASEDQNISWEAARERWRNSHQQLRALLGEIKPEEWDDFVRKWVEGSTYGHYEEHLSALGYASGDIGQLA